MQRIYWTGERFLKGDTHKDVYPQAVGNPIVLTYVNPTFNINGSLDDLLRVRQVDKDLDDEKRVFNHLISTTPANAYNVTSLTSRSEDCTVLSLAFQFYHVRNL